MEGRPSDLQAGDKTPQGRDGEPGEPITQSANSAQNIRIYADHPLKIAVSSNAKVVVSRSNKKVSVIAPSGTSVNSVLPTFSTPSTESLSSPPKSNIEIHPSPAKIDSTLISQPNSVHSLTSPTKINSYVPSATVATPKSFREVPSRPELIEGKEFGNEGSKVRVILRSSTHRLSLERVLDSGDEAMKISVVPKTHSLQEAKSSELPLPSHAESLNEVGTPREQRQTERLVDKSSQTVVEHDTPSPTPHKECVSRATGTTSSRVECTTQDYVSVCAPPVSPCDVNRGRSSDTHHTLCSQIPPPSSISCENACKGYSNPRCNSDENGGRSFNTCTVYRSTPYSAAATPSSYRCACPCNTYSDSRPRFTALTDLDCSNDKTRGIMSSNIQYTLGSPPAHPSSNSCHDYRKASSAPLASSSGANRERPKIQSNGYNDTKHRSDGNRQTSSNVEYTSRSPAAHPSSNPCHDNHKASSAPPFSSSHGIREESSRIEHTLRSPTALPSSNPAESECSDYLKTKCRRDENRERSSRILNTLGSTAAHPSSNPCSGYDNTSVTSLMRRYLRM